MPADENLDLYQYYNKLLEQNYYERLEVSQTATEKNIKKQYRALALKYHPDKNDENNKAIAGLIFGLINDAYQTLINQSHRTQYNNLQKNGLGNLPQQSEYKGKAPFTIANTDATHYISVSDNFTVFSNKGTIHLHNNRTGGFFKNYSRSANNYEVYYNCTISEEENKIFAAHSSGDIDVFDITTGERTECYQAVNNFASGGSGVIRINTDQLLAYDNKKATILTRNNNNNNNNSITIPLHALNDVTLSADKRFIVASSSDKNVKIVHLGTRAVIDELPADFYVYVAQMSPDSKWVAYGGFKNQVILYNLIEKKQQIINIKSTECHALHFSPNGKFLVIGEYDKGYSIYSLETHKIVHQQKNGDIGAFGGYINDIFFTNNNRLIVNAYNKVLNLPLPNSIVANNHLIGAPVLSIKDSTEVISKKELSGDNLISEKQVADEEENCFDNSNQSSDYSEKANPSTNNNRTELKVKLQKYIDRIESYQKPNKQTDFAKGFWFFKDSRAINRKANYLMAKELLAELNKDDTKSDLGFYLQKIETLRSAIIKNNELDTNPNYVNRPMTNSIDLAKILKEAKKQAEKEEEANQNPLNSNVNRF